MKTLHRMVAVCIASAGMLVLGCEHTDDRNVATSPPARGTASRPVGATNIQASTSVVDRLSNARCDREEACNNVGDGKEYASRRVCMDQIHGGIANDLNSFQCPGGLDAAAVQQCLTAIGNEECGAHPIEAITRMDKCRSGAMCVK